DALGNPLRLELTAGQRHDLLKAHEMIVGPAFEFVIADRGYGSKPFLEEIVAARGQPVIPLKKKARQPHQYDSWRYRERSMIECFIGKIKHFRRIFSRFDKLARRYLGFLQLTSSLIWLS